MPEKLNERQKIFIKTFMTFLKIGVRVEIKRHITYFREQVKLRAAPKKEVEKPRVGPNTPKKLIFFPRYVIFFKESCILLHCFNKLRNLKRC